MSEGEELEPRPARAARGRRRRRMLMRGWLTLALLAASLSVFGALLARRVSAGSSQQPAAGNATPEVGLAPPSAESAPEPIPAEVLAHLPVTRDVLEPAAALAASGSGAAHDEEALFELLPSPPGETAIASPLKVEYTFDPRLTRRIFDLLSERGVQLANVVVMDPATGRLLAYVSSDAQRFPPNRTYPAASLIKVVTAAAALHHDRERAEQPCHFLGSPYQLTPARINPPRRGQTVTLERALATSNNQCFAQLAVHTLGTDAMVDAIKRFGFLRAPAPGHDAGTIDPGSDLYDLGRLGCGLWGTWITPLHAVQLGASLAEGQIVEPWWIEHATDAQGRELELPVRHPPRQVMTPALAEELRSMLIETTVSGTARRGFHDRGGNPLLGSVQVAGKTGSLNGTEPAGRYEWFTGVAPADHPSVAIAVVVVLQQRYWLHASQLAGEVLRSYFCESGACSSDTSTSSAAVSGDRPARHATRRGRHRLRAQGG
ncbi:MAG TPA: penicillin-binding transpeptidase domain-containing protein [Myxococcota bacterium]|nr:penicillin-binding transpeptidase domain-containing protein [Myxococcota bacterium]